jgi:hypothetical protein
MALRAHASKSWAALVYFERCKSKKASKMYYLDGLPFSLSLFDTGHVPTTELDLPFTLNTDDAIHKMHRAMIEDRQESANAAIDVADHFASSSAIPVRVRMFIDRERSKNSIIHSMKMTKACEHPMCGRLFLPSKTISVFREPDGNMHDDYHAAIVPRISSSAQFCTRRCKRDSEHHARLLCNRFSLARSASEMRKPSLDFDCEPDDTLDISPTRELENANRACSLAYIIAEGAKRTPIPAEWKLAICESHIMKANVHFALCAVTQIINKSPSLSRSFVFLPGRAHHWRSDRRAHQAVERVAFLYRKDYILNQNLDIRKNRRFLAMLQNNHKWIFS